MHKRDDRGRKRDYTQNELEDALAALIASTKRVHRKLNLLEIAKKIEVARKGLGDLKKLSEAIGLSTEMLRQFSRVTKLSPEVQRYVTQGVIKSVDIADRISRLPREDQLLVAQAVVRGELSGDDVRAIVSFRKHQPKFPIREIISCVTSSRSIKEYVVQFLIPAGEKKLNHIETRFVKLLGKDKVCSVNAEKGVGNLILNIEGKKQLELIAKEKSLTKRELVEKVISGEVK